MCHNRNTSPLEQGIAMATGIDTCLNEVISPVESGLPLEEPGDFLKSLATSSGAFLSSSELAWGRGRRIRRCHSSICMASHTHIKYNAGRFSLLAWFSSDSRFHSWMELAVPLLSLCFLSLSISADTHTTQHSQSITQSCMCFNSRHPLPSLHPSFSSSLPPSLSPSPSLVLRPSRAPT